jgi:hypothetical protein
MARQGYDLALTRHRAPHKLPARLARWVGRGDYTLAGDPERRVAGGAIANSGSFGDRGVANLDAGTRTQMRRSVSHFKLVLTV